MGAGRGALEEGESAGSHSRKAQGPLAPAPSLPPSAMAGKAGKARAHRDGVAGGQAAQRGGIEVQAGAAGGAAGDHRPRRQPPSKLLIGQQGVRNAEAEVGERGAEAGARCA